MPRVRNRKRAARRQRLRAELFQVLGSACSIRGEFCAGVLTVETLEVHHVDGCNWNQRDVNAEHRLYIYHRELRQGIRLAAACRSCNGALNQSEYGTREVPF